MDSWIQVGDSYDYRGIQATVFKSRDAKIEEHYELGIFFGTFEERGLISSTILNSNSLSHAICVFFDEAKSEELRMKYDKRLIQQVSVCCEQEIVNVDNISIKNIRDNLEIMLKKIPSDCWQLNAKWFIDISGSPIPYFTGLLGYLRDAFPRPKLTLFNPTGDYGERKSGYSFTSGFDKNIWVPRLWGLPDPNQQWIYIFLLGFEGSRCSDVYHLCEPKNVKALMSSPGYKSGYEDIALANNKKFLQETGLWIEGEPPDILKSDAANPLETWVILQEFVKEYVHKLNICFVPLGTKGHALGSGLCALANYTPAILYHLPRTYIIRDVKRGEFLWKYEIEI